MAPSFVVTVSYERAEGITFDEEYYNTKHMPLVGKHWQPDHWEVVSFAEGPYTHIGIIYFESKQAFETALKSPGTAEVMGDVPNYTAGKPILGQGSIVARS